MARVYPSRRLQQYSSFPSVSSSLRACLPPPLDRPCACRKCQMAYGLVSFGLRWKLGLPLLEFLTGFIQCLMDSLGLDALDLTVALLVCLS